MNKKLICQYYYDSLKLLPHTPEKIYYIGIRISDETLKIYEITFQGTDLPYPDSYYTNGSFSEFINGMLIRVVDDRFLSE